MRNIQQPNCKCGQSSMFQFSQTAVSQSKKQRPVMSLPLLPPNWSVNIYCWITVVSNYLLPGDGIFTWGLNLPMSLLYFSKHDQQNISATHAGKNPNRLYNIRGSEKWKPEDPTKAGAVWLPPWRAQPDEWQPVNRHSEGSSVVRHRGHRGVQRS